MSSSHPPDSEGAFVHLHLRTDHSLLESAIRIGNLFPRLVELGMTAVAITDRDTMSGVVELYRTAARYGIKPIIGCEVALAASGNHRDRGNREAHSLVLLAKDQTGYRNLVRLCSTAHRSGFHYRPRIDRQLLLEHRDGLIGLSCGSRGEVGRKLRSHDEAAAHEAALAYKEMFAPGDFYLELIADENDERDEEYARMGAALGIPLVATGDCCYLRTEDAGLQELLAAIRDGTATSESLPSSTLGPNYVRSTEEMATRFAGYPDAIAKTVAIADTCNVEVSHGTRFPRFLVGKGQTSAARLRELANDGLAERAAEARLRGQAVDLVSYSARIDTELAVIGGCDADDYFLILWDLVRWARGANLPVGPGRGASPGSLVAYCLRITDIDPVQHSLLFERFLNAGQPRYFPDIDIDVSSDGRDAVVDYLRQTYGVEHVGYAARFYEFSAPALEGLRRHIGWEVSSVVLAQDDLHDHVPCFSGPAGELITQFTSQDLEYAKYPILDLCVLPALSQFADVVAAVNARRQRDHHHPLDLATISIDDPAVYTQFSTGATEGIFELDSPLVQRTLAKVRPGSFEELVAGLALADPRSLLDGLADEYVERRRHGRTSYAHPLLEPILAGTVGLVLYQEQLMQVAHAIAGYDLPSADQLRRTLGKKQPAAVASERARFLEGSGARGIERQVAVEVFESLRAASGVAFCRAHVAAYALLTYRSAYVRYHHPDEFASVARHEGGQ